jgi:hypothetical protein
MHGDGQFISQTSKFFLQHLRVVGCFRLKSGHAGDQKFGLVEF